MVLFGEAVSTELYDAAADLAAECEVMIVVGTTALVRPANDLPWIADAEGASVVEINPEPTSVSSIATISLRGSSGPALDAIADVVESVRSG